MYKQKDEIGYKLPCSNDKVFILFCRKGEIIMFPWYSVERES